MALRVARPQVPQLSPLQQVFVQQLTSYQQGMLKARTVEEMALYAKLADKAMESMVALNQQYTMREQTLQVIKLVHEKSGYFTSASATMQWDEQNRPNHDIKAGSNPAAFLAAGLASLLVIPGVVLVPEAAAALAIVNSIDTFLESFGVPMANRKQHVLIEELLD